MLEIYYYVSKRVDHGRFLEIYQACLKTYTSGDILTHRHNKFKQERFGTFLLRRGQTHLFLRCYLEL